MGKEKKEKKPFKETGFGKFLKKAGAVVKDKGLDVAELAIKAVQGDLKGAIGEVKEILGKEGTPEANALLTELDLKHKEMILEFEKDIYSLEVQDRDSARKREAEIAKAGGQDLLMDITGYAILVAFIGTLSYGFFASSVDKEIYFHIVGLVEGLLMSLVAYFFGMNKIMRGKLEQ